MVQQDSNQMRESADKLVADGQYREAVEQFDNALAIAPDDVETIRKKADAFVKLGDAESALECYDQAIAVDPNSSQSFAEKANTLVALHRYPEALEYYKRGLLVDPENSSILRSKALVLRRLNRPAEALECLDRALAKDQNDPETLANKGDVLLDLAQPAEAIDCFERAAAINSTAFRPSDWTGWGDKLFASGKVQEAVSFYERAISLDRNYVWAWRGKAFALNLDPGKKEEALACLEQALRIYPDALLWVDKGNFYLNEQKYEQARLSYEKASELDPKSFFALFNRGIAFEKEGRFDEAIALIDRAIELDPNSSDSWVEKGYCLGRLNKFENAIKCFDRALDLSKLAFWAWNNKGWALMELGRKDEAVALFDEAITLDGREPIPWVNKSKCLLDLDHPEEARQCLESARSVVIDQSTILYNLGMYYSEYVYDHEKAISLFKQSVSAVLQPDIDASIAECLIKLGKYGEGRKLINDVKNEFTDSMKRCALSYLVMASYALEGDAGNRARTFVEFLDRFYEWEADTQGGRSRRKGWIWNFRGLVNSIVNSQADPETKFLLLAAINLQQNGNTDYLKTFLETPRKPA
jgi:tetratricopeptide (TPR) repeat protein